MQEAIPVKHGHAYGCNQPRAPRAEAVYLRGVGSQSRCHNGMPGRQKPLCAVALLGQSVASALCMESCELWRHRCCSVRQLAGHVCASIGWCLGV